MKAFLKHLSHTASYSKMLLMFIALFCLFASPHLVFADTYTTVFSDNFTDADGTQLTTHNSTWQVLGGTMPVIQNNTLYFPGSYTDPLGPTGFTLADQCSSYDFLYPSTGIIVNRVRQQPNIGGYGAHINQRLDEGGYDIALYSFNSSNSYYLANGFFLSSSISAGWHNFKLCAIGNQITSYLDNTVLLSASSGSLIFPQGSTTLGFTGGNYIDNFLYQSVQTNQAPVVGAVTVTPNPVQINTSVTASASFTDPDTGDTHTATADFGDGTNTNVTCSSVTEPSGSTPGTVSCALSSGYSAANVYPVTITVSDGTASTTSAVSYASVYNPTQSSIFTAGSRFANPSTASPSTSGNVTFGLSYKYQGSMAVGDKAFTMDFNAANLHFNATSVSSLVVSGSTATLQGSGTLNGTSGYSFVVTGVDGGDIRIQITDSSNNVVYDTQLGAALTATPTTSVTGHVKVQ